MSRRCFFLAALVAERKKIKKPLRALRLRGELIHSRIHVFHQKSLVSLGAGKHAQIA